MNTIEEVLIDMSSFGGYRLCDLSLADIQIIDSIASQVIQGTGFTERQSLLILRLLSKYSSEIVKTIPNIMQMISAPCYQLPIRKLQTEKRVSIERSDAGKCIVCVSFPYDQLKVEHIKKNRAALGHPMWDDERRAWTFMLCESTVLFIKDLISHDEFIIDPEFDEYIAQAEQIIHNMDHHVPMVELVNGNLQYKNVSQYVPKLECDGTVVDGLFNSAKHGITVWSDNVVDYLRASDCNPLTKRFLLAADNRVFEVNGKDYSLESLNEIIKHLLPIIFVVGDNELACVKQLHQALTHMGYTCDQISVLFRLPSVTGKHFNDYVKDHALNSSLTDDTKFVIISTKMPKPVLQSNIQFNNVISLGKYPAHYTVLNLLNSCQKLIYYYEHSKGINFGHM